MDRFFTKLSANKNIDIIKNINSIRINKLEDMTDINFPRSYRQFFNSFEFDTFYTNGIEFFGNTGTSGLDDIYTAIFKDKILSKTLLDNGYLQFARPDCGSYDPICFNTNKKRGDECEIVRMCHESILGYDEIKIKETIAPSFRKWLEAI